MLRVLGVATHEHTGAGRAAVRTHAAVAKAGAHSDLLVLHGTCAEPGIAVPGGRATQLAADLRNRTERALLRLASGDEPGFRSLGLGGPGLPHINGSAADVVHLHWIPGMLGISDLPAIRKPVVWTFHDAWPICGAEHYSSLDRPRSGYEPHNRLPGAQGPDLDRWTWQRKRARWRTFAPRIVCSSRWMADEVRASVLFGGREISILPNPLDLSVYRPLDRAAARSKLGLPADRALLLFGADGVSGDRRKGFHVLEDALRRLPELAGRVDLVLAGASGNERVQGFATHWMGYIREEAAMRQLYSACDVLALPSLHDNYPNMLAEAMACGLPVVASDVGGIPDLVRHGETGLLAAPGDAAPLAEQLQRMFADAALRDRIRAAALGAIATACDELAVGRRYLEIYRQAIDEWRPA